MSNFFGNSTTTQGGSLFGSLTSNALAQQPQQQTAGGLFGSTAQKPGGLFGSTIQQPQPQQQQQQSGGGLFGSSLGQQKPQGGGLFGGLGQSQQQQPSTGGGIFGASQQQQPPQQHSNWGGSVSVNLAQSQQQQQQPQLGASFLNTSQAPPLPRLGQSQWQPSPNLREKPVTEQMELLFRKWHPADPECVFQHYFYKNVGKEAAPYFGPQPYDDPRKWEEALKAKPDDGLIPVLARGFGQEGIAQKLDIQAKAVEQLNARAHEINDSLKLKIEQHDLVFSVKAVEARRKHLALSRRCLALATKVQVLRNRGYALDGAEEDLKEKLGKLEAKAFDPVLSGRQEEIWARMTVVRERAQMLKDETEKLGKQAGDGETIDEENMLKVKKLLEDYDSQLVHLRKELDMIKKDFEDWESATKPNANGTSKR